jgi:hypothetical protein
LLNTLKDFILSQNGISTLPTKAARAAAKLALAQAKRATPATPGYRPLHTLDTTLKSPVPGRPWK